MPLRGEIFERQLVQVEQAVCYRQITTIGKVRACITNRSICTSRLLHNENCFQQLLGTWRAHRELRLISNAGSVITTKFRILGFYTFIKAETDNRQEVIFQLGLKYHSTKPKSCALTSFLLSPVGSYHPLFFCAFLFTPFFHHVCLLLALLFPPFFPHIKQNFSGRQVTIEH
jgi:hypothetical protein